MTPLIRNILTKHNKNKRRNKLRYLNKIQEGRIKNRRTDKEIKKKQGGKNADTNKSQNAVY